MKKLLTYSFLAAAAASGLSFAETATTTPVGYVSIGNSQGPAIPASSDTPIAIPLERSAELAGQASLVTANQLTFANNPGLTANQFASGVPYVLKVETGAKAGLVALITANDASSVTLQLQAGDSTSGIVNGDKLSVRKAWTIASLFQGTTLPENTELFVNSGSAVGLNLAPDLLYIFSGGQWYDQGSGELAGNVVLYSGESFVVRNGSSTPITSLVISGEVSTSKARVKVFGGPNGQDNRISYPSPVQEVIGTSGLGFSENDELLVFSDAGTGLDASASTLLVFSGGRWFDQGSGDDVTTTFNLLPGRGYIYRTAPGAPDAATSDTPDYVPSLGL